MDENNTKTELLKEIQNVSFCLDDVRLYLDIQPNDTEALRYYQQHAILRKQLIRQYTNTFGPLNGYEPSMINGWRWIDDPWPWEREM